MAQIHEYKRLENSIVNSIKKAVITVGNGIKQALQTAGRFLTHRYTVVFVPHSEKKVYNLHVTALSLICFILIATGVIGAFFWYGTANNATQTIITGTDSRIEQLQGNLDQFRYETEQLLRVIQSFQSTMSGPLGAIGSDITTQRSLSGDLGSFTNIRETPEGVLPEIEELRKLTAYFSSLEEPIRDIGGIIRSQSTLLTDIPSAWPVQGGAGRISMYFGNNINPFTGQYYLHRGVDISTGRHGDPLIATANGTIATIDYAPDYGIYIIIRHKHGYFTRYAHMHRVNVRLGQQVQQGDVIGYIGSTGLSTGPHVHYEVQLGSDIVDPYTYLITRSRTARPGR
ncbi:MAG: M23 family metallopeptidase [Treponema sp.]|nr:M23 family metallopeptidase [Treponema sp.]